MCKQRNQSGADSKQNRHNHETKVRYGVIVTKKRLFIEHGFVSIGGRESHDKETITGGKGSITQWVHAEYMEGSETIRPTFIQWVRGGYFLKVPTNVPTG